jgi:hypothetical protein
MPNGQWKLPTFFSRHLNQQPERNLQNMKSRINVTLLHLPERAMDTKYRITKITGAITLGAYNGQILRSGDYITEKQAEHLLLSYTVTTNASGVS